MCELVLSCVMPYINDNDDLNSVSLASKYLFDIGSKTRKHVTVHVCFAPHPERVSRRFPLLNSLTLESYSYGPYNTQQPSIPVTPWILEIAKLEHLKSLSIRNMVVSPFDLQLLAKTRGPSLRSLEICGCNMFTEDGLQDIARCCTNLRSLCLRDNRIENDYAGGHETNGKWLHELALCNTVMESLEFPCSFVPYDMQDVTLLVKQCSNSLVSLIPSFSYIFSYNLSDFRQVFELAKKLEHLAFHLDKDYSGFRFPSNIRGLRILDLTKDSFPFLLPYLAQLRELELICTDFTSANCQCYILERCPSLEVLLTWDICGDEGSIVIGQFCKKLRKLTHYERLTEKGLIAVAQGCPNLEYLNLQFSDISNKALECVGTCLKNLRVFRISLYAKGGLEDFPLDNGVRAMLMGCKKLERLDIHIHLSPGVLTDVGLGYIGEYGHNLRHLYLSNTGESDVGLLELLKGCPKLRKLKLNDCPFSKQAIASFVFSVNQSLRYVWLNYNSCDFDVSVLTRPMVAAQVLYLKLAGILHRLALQLVADVSQLVVHPSGAGSVKITYSSSRVTDDIETPLIRNMVANNIWYEEQDTLLGVTSEKPPLEIIVGIANVESRFTSAVSEFGDIKLLCRQVDEPNTIISILGEENVNINSMSVGRPASRKEAVMVIGIDEKPNEEALKKIGEIPAVEEFVFLAM